VHYTPIRDNNAANEIDRIGDDGLQAVEGTVTNVDRRTRTIFIRLATATRQGLPLNGTMTTPPPSPVRDPRNPATKALVNVGIFMKATCCAGESGKADAAHHSALFTIV
jgi:hypothetical protein